jgi:hypothetical protein
MQHCQKLRFAQLLFIVTWASLGFPSLASAATQYSANAVYKACKSSHDDERAFCFAYLDAAALTWAIAEIETFPWSGKANPACRMGLALETKGLVKLFTNYLDAHTEAKSQLAIIVVEIVVCNKSL